MITEQEIAKAHGMSYPAVIRHYAEQGKTLVETARIVGRDPNSFRQRCKRHGWVEWFVAKPNIGYKARIALFRKHAFEHDGYFGTLADHCRRLGLPYSTARTRLKARPGDYDYALRGKR